MSDPAGGRSAVVVLRHQAWWLLAGTLGMLLAALIGPQVGAPTSDVRWRGVLLLAALGGVTTAAVGPRLLPLAQQAAAGRLGRSRIVERGRRLRPLTQGAAVGAVAAAVVATAVTLFPDVLSPVQVTVGHGIPRLLLDQLLWAVPTAGICGAVLGLAGWAVVTQREAVVAFRQLVRGAGTGTWLAWGAAGAAFAASIITGFALAAGSAGAGPVADRMREVAAAGVWWPVGWAAWGTASLGLLAVLVMLADRARPSWRPVAVAVVVAAIAVDLVADVLLAAALPVAASAGERTLFLAVERSALVLSGLVANGTYGIVGLLLVRAGSRDLHPLVRLVGYATFAAALASGVVLVALPSWLTPVVAVSISTFVAFAIGFGWQQAISRRQQPALESAVRRAVRTLVPLHPVPFTTTVRDLAAIDLSVDASALTSLLPAGLAPRTDDDGRVLVTLLGGTAAVARPAWLPRALGLPSTPLITLRVGLDEGDGAVTYLRGWADGTFTAAAVHWLTELQLSRVDLKVRTGDGVWQAVGSAGSLRIALSERTDGEGGLRSTPTEMTRAVVVRGGRLAEVALSTAPVDARPADVRALDVPFLNKLDARVVGAALLGDTVQRFGRARWR